MKRVRLSVKAPGARKVMLAADFTDWEANARRMRPYKPGSDTFVARISLAPGTYEYKFLVDGHWMEDPDAEAVANSFGTLNSRLTVSR
jgi:1,4-alpha-glucan branching enzyme